MIDAGGSSGSMSVAGTPKRLKSAANKCLVSRGIALESSVVPKTGFIGTPLMRSSVSPIDLPPLIPTPQHKAEVKGQ